MGHRNVRFPKASSETHDALVGRLARDHALLLDVLRQAWPQAFNQVRDPEIVVVRLEHPVVVGSRPARSGDGWDGHRRGRWVVGFIDLAVGVRLRRPVTVIGTAPLVTTVLDIQELFFVEVKSGRVRPGELLRQINFYRAHGKDGYWIVVGPDGRHADLLRSQDVAFVRMMAPQ
jgi:hypothetical protein